MPITSIQRDTNNNVSLVRMISTDSLAVIDGTDYIAQQQENINALNGGTWQWFITDMILCAAEDGNAFFEFIDDTFTSLVIFGSIGSGIINPGMQYQLPYYSTNGRVLSPLTNMANAILATNGSQIPGLTQTLPTAVQMNITSVGTIGTGVWNGTGITVPFGGTGAASFTAYSVICGGTTSTGALQNVSGLGTSGFILTSNGPGALPSWQASPGSGTVSPGLQNQIAYYAANGSTVSGLTSIASGVLVTSGLGVPSISTTLPDGLAMGTPASLVLTNATGLPVAGGGTGLSSLTAHNLIIGNGTSAPNLLAPSATSGIPLVSQGASADPAYSTAVVAGGGTGLSSLTAYAVLCGGTTSTGNVQQVSGLGTSGFILTSNGAGALPTWQANAASGTVNAGTINQLAWYAATGSAVSGLATADNGVLVTSAGGVPSISTTLPTGLAMQTPASINLANGTSLPVSTGISGLGTGVATALGVNVGTAGAFVVNGGALGTPSSGNLSNATSLPISTGVSGLGTGVATALAIALGSAGAMLRTMKIIGQSYDLSTASGSLAFTGAGFKPRYLLLMLADNNGGPSFSFGMWDGSSGFGTSNFSVSSAAVTGFTSTTGWQLLGVLNGTNYVTASVASLDSDGFTLTMTKNGSPTGTVNIYAMCMA